jgi:hypothetical protein
MAYYNTFIPYEPLKSHNHSVESSFGIIFSGYMEGTLSSGICYQEMEGLFEK